MTVAYLLSMGGFVETCSEEGLLLPKVLGACKTTLYAHRSVERVYCRHVTSSPPTLALENTCTSMSSVLGRLWPGAHSARNA
eukprot:6375560-Pyramimonas_sp.AAC.1